MESKVCLDTDFLVNFLRNRKEEVEFLKSSEADKELATTYVNLFELYFGAYRSADRENNLKAIERLLGRVMLLNFSEESARKAGEIASKLEKEGKQLEIRDIFIGAIALAGNYAVKTGNARHFRRIEGLSVLD